MGNRMTLRVVLCVCIFSLLTACRVNAQVSIEGGKEVHAVSGGDRINKTIVIHNTTAESIPLKAYWEDFQYEPPYDGTKLFLPAGTGTRSLSKWISFSPVEFVLPPFGQQVINYSLSIPAEIDSGHYGVLFFEKPTDPQNMQTGMQIVMRVGSLFFVEPKDAVRKAEFRDIALAEKNIIGSFHNDSTVVLIPDTNYYFMDDQGLVTDRGILDKMYIAPNGTAAFKIPVLAGLHAGKHTLVINAELGDTNVVVKEIEIAKASDDTLTILTTRD